MSEQKNVLVLGAGMVSKPLVRYLLDVENIYVTMATRTVSKAETIIDGHPRGEAISWTVDDKEKLDDMIYKSDIVISLLPYIYHTTVAKICIKYKKNLVTTSYVSKEMQELDKKAKDAGVLILNEIGLDPGIDHMSAMEIIHQIQNRGGTIEHFSSYCGALPSVEANTNPLGYKFSWSPKGVVLAGKNDARYLKNGKVVKINTRDLFKDVSSLEIENLAKFDVYPNRDSIPYIEKYNIKKTKTMFRGTMRFPGWCELWDNFKKLNFLDEKVKETKGMSNKNFIALIIESKGEDIKNELSDYLCISRDSDIIKKFEWLGFFDENEIIKEDLSPFDLLFNILFKKLQFNKGEKDMVVLHHEFIGLYPDGKREKITSTMVDYGDPEGDTAVARTVSFPAAIATKLILQEKINLTGVHIPILSEIYEPVLQELEKIEIKFNITKKML
jgi:saccharopine dehydrogenase-like NADP-dependent oxidoreductase